MRLFISVPSKLLFLILTILLVISAGYSWYSLERLEGDFKQHQVETLKQGELQLEQHVGQLKSQLTAWLESFSDINQLQDKGDFVSFAQSLEKQYDGLQMHFNIENIWLVKSGAVLYGTDKISPQVLKNTKKVLAIQQPVEEIYCLDTCVQLISIPLLNFEGEVAVVSLTASLVDILYAINSVLDRDVAILKIPQLGFNHFQQITVVSTSNKRLTDQLINLKDSAISFNHIANQGEILSVEESFYLANFLFLAETKDSIYTLTLIEDVTKLRGQNKRNRDLFLLTIFVVFIAVAILIYFIINPFTSKLLTLSHALPMLSRREFSQFRDIDLSSSSMFEDEFDVLANSTGELSVELEKLNLEVEQKTKELENIAMYDILTGLPNRNMLNFSLKKQVAKLALSEHKIAVLFLDLDDFKKVNDSHGHGEGDRLLMEAANRIRESVRNTDLVCRFGGDEFVVVLHQISYLEQVIEVAEKIIEKFRQPIKLDASLFYVSTSIGIVVSDQDDIKADSLISFADIAMYEAKDHGGAQYHVYHTDMYNKVAQRVFMENEVRQALIKQQFSISLQPQITAKDHKLYGFEALLRWQHPERGMISPDDFIPILENSEHMIELGYWVMKRCFEVVTVFKALGYCDMRIAINLSAGQFSDPNLKSYLQSLLAEFNLSPSHFELELTEQTLVKDVNHTIDMMNELKLLGFSFAIDDFGTGYSSLSYLKKMPVDVIKIDKSFVFGMLENKADHQIILSTIAMVKNLELTVVAEGVETSAQLRSLTENNCDIIQGYYFSKPIPETEIYDFITKHITNGYWKTHADCPTES
ncbi:MAG: putative bifunctional diguanylate cyclase/phosphodiesterase [Thalassotalea sp.]